MPRFIHIQYNGAPETSKNIALVGKGITFDSGGSSLKPAASMTTMKTDMSGAALMFAVTKLIAELEYQHIYTIGRKYYRQKRSCTW